MKDVRRGKARGRILREGARDQLIDLLGNAGAQRPHARDRRAHVLVGHLDERVATVGRRARQAGVQHGTERVHVDPAVEALAEGLLGRDVVAGAEHAAGCGQLGRLIDARDAEVCELDEPVSRDQHVLRLDVTVDHAALVGVRQRLGDLRADRERLGDRQVRRLRDVVREVGAIDVLADDERPPVPLAPIDHRDDPGVRERRERARLALEAADRVRRGRALVVQPLERDRAHQLLVLCEPDARVSPAPEQLLDAEARSHGLTDHPRAG